MSELRSVTRLRDTARINHRRDRHAENLGYRSPTFAFCAEPYRLVSSEDSFGRPYSGGHTLPNQFAFQFGEGRKDVKEEPRHGIGVIGVDVLGDSDETNT